MYHHLRYSSSYKNNWKNFFSLILKKLSKDSLIERYAALQYPKSKRKREETKKVKSKITVCSNCRSQWNKKVMLLIALFSICSKEFFFEFYNLKIKIIQKENWITIQDKYSVLSLMGQKRMTKRIRFTVAPIIFIPIVATYQKI